MVKKKKELTFAEKLRKIKKPGSKGHRIFGKKPNPTR